jgi:mannose-1-phosphate guanylyltransferase
MPTAQPESAGTTPAVHAVIMAGGGGTRFWPRSRRRRPKQFLHLTGEGSLLQQALRRIEALTSPGQTWVVTSAAQRPLVAEQLSSVPSVRIIGEPCGRDTAACIALAAALIAEVDPEGVMVATPADHVIEPEAEFRRAILGAAGLAREHPRALIALGISPTYPATGYGYIQRGRPVPGRQRLTAHRIARFKEKPDAATARAYLETGEYYWNSGIFIARVSAIRAALREQQPGLFAAAERIVAAWGTPEQDRVFQSEYEPLAKLSIDVAVMEGCRDGLVVEAPFRWDDVGSWQAVERMHPQDAEGNTVLANHAGLNTRNCLVVGDRDRLIATVGVENLIIVQDGDAILVADKRDEAAIKKLVEHLRQTGHEAFL